MLFTQAVFYFVKNIVVIIDLSCVYISFLLQWEKNRRLQVGIEYQPTGDQPQAIEKLVQGFKEGNKCQTLLGVTGSGKIFTMANVIARLNKPTLILAHNKTLAAQLYGEFKEFFPENAVEYFASYYGNVKKYGLESAVLSI